MKCKYSSSDTINNFCHKMIWTACYNTATYILFRCNKWEKLRLLLKATITFWSWIWGRQTWKVKSFCRLAKAFSCTLFTSKKGREKLLLLLFSSFKTLLPQPFSLAGPSITAVDFITIPGTSSFTQEFLWSDTPRTQFLHKALRLLHWMATNLQRNRRSGTQGIIGRGVGRP